jgi:hypothetical protein
MKVSEVILSNIRKRILLKKVGFGMKLGNDSMLRKLWLAVWQLYASPLEGRRPSFEAPGRLMKRLGKHSAFEVKFTMRMHVPRALGNTTVQGIRTN